MIRLERVRTLAAVHQNFRDTKKEDFELELMEERRSIFQGVLEKHKFKSGRWKAAKKQLLEETGGKCAYCEAPTSAVAFGDVEHYRPKSKYWWLAYSYDNYLASCQLCNQKFKSDRFPIKNAKMRGPVIKKNTSNDFINNNKGKIAPNPLDQAEIDTFKELHRQEGAFLLNPYFDEPEEFFAWQADDVLKEVEVVPKPGNAEAKAYCKAAEDVYGLNRFELKRLRYKTFRALRIFMRSLDDAGLSQGLKDDIEVEIETMKQGDEGFAGMVRYFDENGIN